MRLGVSLPQFGRLAHEAPTVAGFAKRAEGLGVASLWVGERLLAPVNPSVGYSGGPGVPAEFNARLDPFALLSVAAAVTTRVQLGTNVLILPWYQPALLARLLTSIDAVSSGRLVPGFGIGWSPEEYAAMGIPFSARGKRLDEGLDALIALWETSPAEYHGQYWTLPATHTEQLTRRPPFYLAGFSESALRRVGARADGWLPAMRQGGKIAPLLRARSVIDAAAREAERDPADIDIVLRINVPAPVPEATIAETIREVAGETGIDHVFIDLMYVAADTEEALRMTVEILDTVNT